MPNTPQIDPHGQPTIRSFNRSRNREKAIFGLKGILEGIVADQRLNEQELLFLDVWLRSQEALGRDGDVVDLLDLTSDILRDGFVTADELADLNQLIYDIVEYKKLSHASAESQINELLGFLSGVAADGVLKEQEIRSLCGWLDANVNICDEWPANRLVSRINEILEDGIITPEENADLLETIKNICGHQFEETGVAHGMTTEFFEDILGSFSHEGQSLCFSGKFVSGTRKVVESAAQRLGASVKRDVTKEVTALVIGTIASRDWRFSSHGRKIEKAIKLREGGSPVVIMTERTWLKYI
jgi:hypothetical protein